LNAPIRRDCPAAKRMAATELREYCIGDCGARLNVSDEL